MDNLDLLCLVFKRTLEFLSIEESLKVVNLNKAVRERMQNIEVFRILSIRILQETTENTVSGENCFQYMLEFTGLKVSSYQDLFYSVVHSCNLLKNPCGAQGFDH